MSDPSKASAYISLGSNLGDRAGNLLLGIRGMMDAGLSVVRLSSIYESEPVETFAQPYFLNMVAELGGGSLTNPEQLMARLLRVEYALGRRREATKGPRVIDLDLLAPTLVHPTLHQTIAILLENVDDQSEVKHWVPNAEKGRRGEGVKWRR